MSQIKTKWIASNAVTAAKLGSGAATATQALFADGSGNAAYRAIASGDLPALSYANQALSNLSSVAINSALLPASTGTIALGSAALNFQDFYLSGKIQSAFAVTISSGAVGNNVSGSTGTITMSGGVPTGIEAGMSITGSGLSSPASDYYITNVTATVITVTNPGSVSFTIPASGTWYISSAIQLQTAANSTAGAQSGAIRISSGSSNGTGASSSGGLFLNTGSVSGTGTPGNIYISAGTNSSSVQGTIQLSGTVYSLGQLGMFSPINMNPLSTGAQKIINLANGTASGDAVNYSQISGLLSSALTTNYIFVGNGSNVATGVAMSGDASIVASGAVTVSNAAVIAKVLTGYVSGAGTVSASDSILSAIQKLNGNIANISGSAITSLTGDITASGPGAAAATLATVNTNTGSWGSASSVATFTVNGKGLITAASNTSIQIAQSQVTGLTTALAGYLPLTGGTMSGVIAMGSNKITGLATPTASTDAATKGYVDASISGLTWEGPAKAYAASNVPLTGGATLTIDGYSVQNGDLVILGNQSTASQNGEYVASGIGTAYTLTANGLPTAAGDAWLITNGTVYKNSAFVANAAVPSATFTAFAGPTAYVFNSPLSVVGNTVSISQANTSTNGYLSSTDWNTFNGKQAAGNYITALTGDATASGPGSAALTLATVNSNVGSFGGASSVPSFTVNGKGLITAASATAVVAPAGTLSGTTLNATVVSSSLTSVGTIGTGTWQGTAVGIGYGGTGQTTAAAAFAALSPMTTAGDIIYENATPTPARLAIGSTNQVLTVIGGLPSWQTPSAVTTSYKDTFVLASGDITNQYVTLTHAPIANSTTLFVVGGGAQLEGASYDYTISGSQLLFQNGLATSGVSALVVGDILQVEYMH